MRAAEGTQQTKDGSGIIARNRKRGTGNTRAESERSEGEEERDWCSAGTGAAAFKMPARRRRPHREHGRVLRGEAGEDLGSLCMAVGHVS